jgi:hypothetical protein
MFLSYDGDGDHGIRWADTLRALTWWQCLWASHEAADTPHRAMCLAPHEPGGMVFAFAVDFIPFLYMIDNRLV